MTRDHAAARARRRCRPLTSAYRLAVAREFADGASLRGVAEALRVDPAQLHRWLRTDDELRALAHLAHVVATGRAFEALGVTLQPHHVERVERIEAALFAPAHTRDALLGPMLRGKPSDSAQRLLDASLRFGPKRVAHAWLGRHGAPPEVLEAIAPVKARRARKAK